MLFEVINKWKGLEKVKVFLWKLGHECFLTNSMRMGTVMSHSNFCPFGDDQEESLFYLFWDCQNFLLVWKFFICIDGRGKFYTNDSCKDWLLSNTSNDMLVHGVLWGLLFGDSEYVMVAQVDVAQVVFP